MSRKQILEFLTPFIKRFERKIRKTRGSSPTVKYGEFKNSNGGILWGGDKELGKLYQAYCYGDLLFKHGYKEGFFEDCIQSARGGGKNANAAEARKKGWIIGTGEYKGIPVCPQCQEKIKKFIEKRSVKNENK